MLEFLDVLPLWALGAVTVGACVLFGIGASTMAHRFGWTLHPDDIDSGTVLHALVGLVYAVALGLIVVDVQDDHSAVKHAAVTEAGALADMYDALAGIEAEPRDALRARLATYVDLVVSDEWPALHDGRASAATERELHALSAGVIALQPQTAGGQSVHRALLEELDAASEARRRRIFIGSRGVSSGTWAVVLLGAMIAIGFASLFPLRVRGRRAVLALTASIFGLMLFLMVATSRPLRGQLGVGPDAFTDLQAELQSRQGEAQAPPGR